MLTDKEITHISKFLSLVLRHKPETLQLTLDENGWADTTTLLTNMNKAGTEITFELLKHIVDTNAKKRFAFNNDASQIRASQGHSLNIELGYSPQQPPEILYHGTAQKNIASITANGLEKQNRQHVHLSSEIATAVTVGSRHGNPIVFKVAALQMHTDGYTFFVSENNVWLTDTIPPEYITII